MQCFKFPVSFCKELNSIMSRFWWGKSCEGESNFNWLSWRKLCTPKAVGGMGFRDFTTFNQALLAKQAWKLMMNPDALWAKVLKAIYFPFSNVLNVKKGRTSSWGWKSLVEGIEVLKMGTRWNVCNGKDILIWEDRWIPMLDSFKVTTPHPPRSEPTLVSSLIDFNRRSWKINLLQDLFQEEEVRAILSIPVGNPEGCDTIVWHFTRDGKYTVEPKVKNFVWRACHNALATKENLARRLKHQNVTCCRCDEEKESLEHILFFCPFAKAVWGSSQFNYCPDKVGFSCFWKWWNDAVMQMPEFGSFNPKGLIAYICWNIWKYRNALIFEGKVGNPIDVWRIATREFQSYLDSQEEPDAAPSQSRTAPSWSPPPTSVIKICCDASFDAVKKEAGIAAVARDFSGAIVGGANMVVRVCSAPVAEAMAIRLGCFLAIEKNGRK